jgi:hypothetical protein
MDAPVSLAGKSDPVDHVHVNSAENAAAVNEFATLCRTVRNDTVDDVAINVESIENCFKWNKV